MLSPEMSDKLALATYSALLFALAAHPLTFRAVNAVTSKLGLNLASSKGCANWKGLLVHGVVFALLMRLVLHLHFNLPGVSRVPNRDMSEQQKWMLSLYGGLLFMAIAHPFLFQQLNKLKLYKFTEDGCASDKGVLTHAIVFGLVMLGVMHAQFEYPLMD